MTLTVGSAILIVLAFFFTVAIIKCIIPLIVGVFAFLIGLAGKSSDVAAYGTVVTAIYGVCFVVFSLLDWWVISALQKYFH